MATNVCLNRLRSSRRKPSEPATETASTAFAPSRLRSGVPSSALRTPSIPAWSDASRPSSAGPISGRHPALTHTRFGALRLKDGICDQLREVTGSRPDIAPDRPAVRVPAEPVERMARAVAGGIEAAAGALRPPARAGFREPGGMRPAGRGGIEPAWFSYGAGRGSRIVRL